MRRTLALVAVVVAVAVAVPAAAQTARTRFAAAQAREKALRSAVSSGRKAPLSQYRTVVAVYERVSRDFRATGYADNALWQAALLSRDAHARFGDERDRRTARRLLQALVAGYPSSSLVPKARLELARLDATLKPAAPPNEKPGAAPPAAAPAAPPRAAAPTTEVPPPPAPPAASPPAPGSEPSLLELRHIRRTVKPDGVRVTIEVEREVPFRIERVENPPRVLFDLAGTRPGEAILQGTLSYPDGLVRYIRVGRQPNDVTRVVFDLEGAARYSSFSLYDPYRIVIDFEGEAPPPMESQRIGEEPLAPLPLTGEPDAADAARPRPATAADSRRPVTEDRVPATSAVSGAPAAPAGAATAAADAAREHRLTPKPVPSPVLRPIDGRGFRQYTGRLPVAIGWALGEFRAPVPVRPATPAWAAVLPPPVRGDRAAIALALAPEVPPAPKSTPPPPSGPKASTPPPSAPAASPSAATIPPVAPAPLAGGFSLARQLGLGVSRVVIDAGHGGHDPGALGSGVTEAAVVLDVALRLEKLLKASGVEVVLTRRTNTYLTLEERTRIANAARGDLFLSIHANASRNKKAQGIETYVLNFASNPDAEAVAARENAAASGTMSNLAGIVRAIALNNKLDESRGLAASVQAQLVKKLKGTRPAAADHGVKQAPFVVLIGASMPSVLVEVSFITHAQEGRLLKTAPYRQKIAQALFEGIRGYQRALKRVEATAGGR